MCIGWWLFSLGNINPKELDGMYYGTLHSSVIVNLAEAFSLYVLGLFATVVVGFSCVAIYNISIYGLKDIQERWADYKEYHTHKSS